MRSRPPALSWKTLTTALALHFFDRP